MQFFIFHSRLWSDCRRTLISLVLNLFLVSKISHRRSTFVHGIMARDRYLLLYHDESFYFGDYFVNSLEDEESASPAAKRGVDGHYEDNFDE